jgi:hypothetical protein
LSAIFFAVVGLSRQLNGQTIPSPDVRSRYEREQWHQWVVGIISAFQLSSSCLGLEYSSFSMDLLVTFVFGKHQKKAFVFSSVSKYYCWNFKRKQFPEGISSIINGRL